MWIENKENAESVFDTAGFDALQKAEKIDFDTVLWGDESDKTIEEKEKNFPLNVQNVVDYFDANQWWSLEGGDLYLERTATSQPSTSQRYLNQNRTITIVRGPNTYNINLNSDNTINPTSGQDDKFNYSWMDELSTATTTPSKNIE
jgi:hypothetical protein